MRQGPSFDSSRQAVMGAALLLLGVACSPTTQGSPPARTAPLSEAVTAPPRTVEVAPAAGVVTVALACQAREAPLDNGIDDDCDGRVDRDASPSDAALSLAVEHPAAQDVQLSLVGPDGHSATTESVTEQGVCAEGAPFALTRLRASELTPGEYSVRLQPGSRCTRPSPTVAHLSILTADGHQLSLGAQLVDQAPVTLATVRVR